MTIRSSPAGGEQEFNMFARTKEGTRGRSQKPLDAGCRGLRADVYEGSGLAQSDVTLKQGHEHNIR